ncbi:hypothetical protein GLOTRDRAFT_73225 [Gloeophyllum trabeum ATCC 11539]|uniref:Glyoxalase-like domain-containing protein n=1 Tax=Gloeophyllum trabeum (strain ATCC 11539 / FP-39264 / Madison 617) TaxID=670483 RepID=S7QHE4_GLOTA|nr:uncharacterized protein GLOTRDRAFT_73225 [Gloeophyllum trabeum ATCC 11539]EPQ58673.1 hypothetical protein GLOTRDRAFT_73225 [Gloeophyllum trabeum ATCC 11539]
MAHPTNVLDHIVHLTPSGSVAQAAEQWQKLGFTVVPGGTHADGLTANALVVLRDGAYVELVSFARAPCSHPWGSKRPGWIDYAFLGSSARSVAQIVNARAREEGSGVVYEGEVRGGRERPDGRAVEWVITAPRGAGRRGVWPFFCGDVTPRGWRVPLEPEGNAVHENGAVGVAHVRVLAEEAGIPALTREYTTVVGSPPVSSQPGADVSWTLASTAAAHSIPDPVLVVSAPRDAQEEGYLRERGAGLYEVAFWVVEGEGGKGDGESEETPYGRVVWRVVKEA